MPPTYDTLAARSTDLHDRCTHLRQVSKALRKDSDDLRAYLHLLLARAVRPKEESTPPPDEPFELF